MMNDQLRQLINEHQLNQFLPFCKRLIDAFDGYPDIEQADQPEYQMTRYLQRCELTEHLGIQFKHQLSNLTSFQLRAYKIRDNGCVEFFDPLKTSYAKFSKNADIHCYANTAAYPPVDVVLKKIELELGNV